jgi:DNA-binding transcriptional ArsR family regulator
VTTRSADSALLRRARAITHPLRQVLIYEYGRQITSPSKIAAAIREPVNVVSYHTRVLLDAGWLELVRVEPRRGAREHFYRATGWGAIEDAEWDCVPVSARRSIARSILQQIWREATHALPSGGMDDGRSHISSQLFRLDDQGRTELAALLLSTANAAAEIERSSARRAADKQAQVELAILAFTEASAW